MSHQPDPFNDDLQQSSKHKYRIRHINGVSIRNLTPFPKRDAVASTLSETSAASSKGLEQAYIPDDADLALARRRSRKISTTSINTLRSLRSQDDTAVGLGLTHALHPDLDDTPRSRRLSKTRPPLSNVIPISAPPLSGSSRRPRSASQASVRSHLAAPGPPSPSAHRRPNSPLDSYPFFSKSLTTQAPSSTLQRSLEKVLSTRLVDTLITFSAPEDDTPIPQSPVSDTGSRSPPPISQRINGRTPSKPRPSPLATRNTGSRASTSKAGKNSSASNSRASTPIQPETHQHSPFYVSSTHRASTNPSWLGLDSESEFLPWADGQSTKVDVTLWAKIDNKATKDAWKRDLHGKGKAREDDFERDPAWEPVLQWEADLADVEPLPTELLDHPHRLPPNTLIFALGEPATLHWIPPDRPTTRPASRASGHIVDLDEPPSKEGRTSDPKRDGIGLKREGRLKTSAGLQDIVKMVTLQSVLADTRTSVDALVETIDHLVEDDRRTKLVREAGERALYIGTVHDAKDNAISRCQNAREIIASRKDALAQRRAALGQARGLLEEEQRSVAKRKADVADAQVRLDEVTAEQNSHRMQLIQILDWIYPIEPVSSQDLLFAIQDAPLPLPNGPIDPAPPLTVPGNLDINEQTMATALGYAAQVVGLVAVYLGRILPYPVTYAASRSMIRDPISTMQGPRIFPLFPTGVETYRFEYAVFLLNKDIEILMSERNLRALDMRHTLPNLKNLLLTLTNGTSDEGPSVKASANTRSIDVSEAILASESPESTADATPTATPRRQFLSPLAAMLRSKYASVSSPHTTNLATPRSNGSSSSPLREEVVHLPVVPSVVATEQSDTTSGSEGSSGSTAADEEDDHEGQEDDDNRTERGVKVDDAPEVLPADGQVTGTVDAPPSKETVKSGSSEGYGNLAGNVLSSFFWRTAPKREVEKDGKGVPVPQSTPLPPVQNAVT